MPKLINMVFDGIMSGLNKTPKIGVYNKHMRSAEEIMKDYGLEG